MNDLTREWVEKAEGDFGHGSQYVFSPPSGPIRRAVTETSTASPTTARRINSRALQLQNPLKWVGSQTDSVLPGLSPVMGFGDFLLRPFYPLTDGRNTGPGRATRVSGFRKWRAREFIRRADAHVVPDLG